MIFRSHVASIDTLSRRLPRLISWVQKLDLIVTDECHHVPAQKWKKVLAAASHAQVLGVTATPWRADGKGLGKWFTDVVRGPSIRDLTADGYLSPAAVFAPASKIDLSSVRKRGGDYVQGELAVVLDQDPHIMATVRAYSSWLPGVPLFAGALLAPRSEERRVGKECV